MRHIAIVGASLAGLNAAQELRAAGHDGPITLIGREAHRPYDRPPLSKTALTGQTSLDSLRLDPKGIEADWVTGHSAVALDATARRLTLDDGRRLPFDGLVIASGATPRRLPLNELRGVHLLRTLEDAQGLKDDLARRPSRVVVIGGGFIGTEIAATCRSLGLAVTLVEGLPGLLYRAAGDMVSSLVTDLHREQGVDLRLDLAVRDAVADGTGRVTSLVLSDGSKLDADVVVVAIGVVPQTGWLAGSGLEIGDGVGCDETCLAAPGIVAAGDIARWPNRKTGEHRRVEHWDNAIRQGRHAARRLLAVDEAAQAYAPLPWVWSDQFGRKLHIYGSTLGADEVRLVSPPTDGRFVAIYRRGRMLAGVFGLGRVREVLVYRALLEADASWDAAITSKAA